MDGPAIRRLFEKHGRGLIQRWVGITDAAMHERPHGFTGFRVSPAAFLIDGVQNNRTPPDWMHAHEKRQEQRQWTSQRAAAAPADDGGLRPRYDRERDAALQAFLASDEGRAAYRQTYPILLAFHKATDPRRCHKLAHDDTVARVGRTAFQFADFAVWVGRQAGIAQPQA